MWRCAWLPTVGWWSKSMLRQAAQTGARSRLFLLDEVDAALDESNQARVAALLHQMCAAGNAQRCQVSVNSSLIRVCA